jgi:hypothetical protein
LKRATHTPNRFITSTRSWPAKGLALFLILFALGSCEDDLGLIGNKKLTSRFGVYFKEFVIPVTTVQTDSIISTALISERLLCGSAQDPNFGKSTAMFYTQFRPTLANINKIDLTGKSDFSVISVKIVMVFGDDYYVYGDTSNTQLSYDLHKITDDDYWITKDNYTTSTLEHDPTPIASGTFQYIQDSIRARRKRNFNASNTDNAYDTIAFALPNEFGQDLLDSARAKGVYSFNTKGEWAFDARKTDSVFRLAFPGFALKASGVSNRIMGFKSELGITVERTSRIILDYSYVQDGSTVFAQLMYFNSTAVDDTGLGFTNISVDRNGTALADLSQTDPADIHTDFNAPDDYCYMQSGTGLYAKLDLSEVHDYFDAVPDTIPNVAINSAQLIVEAEPDGVRHHLSQPASLFFRVANLSNSFFKLPIIETASGQAVDQTFAVNYNCLPSGLYLDARGDEAFRLSIPLTQTSDAAPQYYKAYISDFVEYFLRVPAGFPKIYHMGLVPAQAPFGKSFHGLSFKKDKVKLRVYYTKTL